MTIGKKDSQSFALSFLFVLRFRNHDDYDYVYDDDDKNDMADDDRVSASRAR